MRVLAVLRMVCSVCGNHSEHVLRKLTTKVTLFWIPLFPVGRKHMLFCPGSDSDQKVPKEQARPWSPAARRRSARSRASRRPRTSRVRRLSRRRRPSRHRRAGARLRDRTRARRSGRPPGHPHNGQRPSYPPR